MNNYNNNQSSEILSSEASSGSHIWLKTFTEEQRKSLHFKCCPIVSPRIKSSHNLLWAGFIISPDIEISILRTDTPYGAKNNLRKSIDRINQLELSKNDKELILGLNIKRLLKL